MAEFHKHLNCTTCCLKRNIFSCLSEDEMKSLDKDRYEVTFKVGETIMKQGAALTHITCITNGNAKIYLEGLNNKNLLIKITKGIEVIGGPGLFTDYRHHYSACSLTDLTACFIEVKAFEKIVESNNEFAKRLLQHINKQEISNLNKLVNLTQKHMHGRVAEMLLYLSDQIYESDEFHTRLSRQDLADLTAMTKESLIRILKEMKNDGLVDPGIHDIKILDKDSLRNISITG